MKRAKLRRWFPRQWSTYLGPKAYREVILHAEPLPDLLRWMETSNPGDVRVQTGDTVLEQRDEIIRGQINEWADRIVLSCAPRVR